ncbi:spermidine synthase [Actinacidiphila sp. ITFR-21]|uniref:spermidine synthase n=1 Tax=Actinacidiphila sp. ITFR-21 TaxID=3075199 RepID=UPI0028890C78|nr:fused MFS/spermidine synthase [Streptomyces sp. ITFR-21]WNI14217.1 fused MFS/spermidine synthase [Streptomyces sp. ITFR-21]
MSQEPLPVTRAVDFGTAKLLPDLDRPRAWLLTVDGAPQSYVDLDEPAHLEFEYVRRVAYVVESCFDTPVDAVHLGGGALTLPRRLAVTRPGSRQQVVEADRALAALVAERLPSREPGIAVHTADAREWLTAAPGGSADVVVTDVFGGSRVPAHLTTVEFLREAVRVLRPDGVYVANLADADPFAFLGSQLATVREAFGPDAELCLLAEPAVLRGRRFGNAVLAATRRPLPLEELVRRCAGDVFPARVVTGHPLRDLTRTPVHDARAVPSPEPPDGAFTVG